MIKLELPEIKDYSESDYTVAQELLENLWYRLSNNLGATSLPFYMDKFSSHNEANKMIIRLANSGIIKTDIAYNYATIELNKEHILTYMSEEEFYEEVRANKLSKYKPLDKVANKSHTRVALPSGIQATGLSRPGLAKAGTHKYQYDITMMKKYYKQVVQNSIKAMKKLEAKLEKSLFTEEGIDYEATIRATLDFIISNNNAEFCLGDLLLDSRGRAIHKCLTTIFNPISSKFARALIKHAPTKATYKQLDDAYLFIAELVDGFNGDIKDKLVKGNEYYANRVLPEPHKPEDFFEVIWCERLYAELDAWHLDSDYGFTVPVEVDFSSSNMVMIGLLLGHSPYVDHTQYMWEIEGLSKLHIKKAQTPYVFGSQAPITKLWKKAGLKWTADQVKLMKFHQAHGKFAIANMFKDIIVNHCQPEAIMNLLVDEESFRVECNRHKYVGDTTKQYVVYNSSTKSLEVISHTAVVKVPDLFRFKTYFVTGIIHNLDSQVMDYMCDRMEWVLPIHDAGIVTIAEARKFKHLAMDKMNDIYSKGPQIVHNYFKSINLDDAGWKKYAQLQHLVKEANKDKKMVITPWLLK